MEASKAFLRKTDADGVSVYSHLTDVLTSLLEIRPTSALDSFESVSLLKKTAHYQAGTVAPGEVFPELPPADAPVEAAVAWATQTAELLKKTAAAASNPEAEEPTGQVSNLLLERALFEAAGVGLPSLETYRISASLVALQKDKDLASVRFFGKILGVPSDYYIAEAAWNTPPEPEEGEGEPPPPPPGAPIEDAGTGCNKYVYFATSDPAVGWTLLPDVTPQQIVYSKRVRKYLTGNLEADVRAYPPFPGPEKCYLRALIARIVASTTLCPTGKFNLDEEDEGAEPVEVEVGEEGRTPPPASALGEVSGWCTRYMGILDIGRTTNVPVEEEEAEEGEDKPKAPEPQPPIKALSPIGTEEWAVTTYTQGGPTVAIARSLKWPGAYNAYQKAPLGQFGQEILASIYIGYGHEELMKPFVMEAPPPFEEEPPEVHEQADMPLEEENEIFIAKETERIAAEAAELPDPEPEE